uniref:Uncharacterized protein n=1 Tax=Arundo donax TaxID=35708 RepID=A0A0A9ERR6_ARUDO
MNNMVAARGASHKKIDGKSFWAWLRSLFGCCKKEQELESVPA